MMRDIYEEVGEPAALELVAEEAGANGKTD